MFDTDNYILASLVRQYPVSLLSDRDVKIAHRIDPPGTATRHILHGGGCIDNADSVYESTVSRCPLEGCHHCAVRVSAAGGWCLNQNTGR